MPGCPYCCTPTMPRRLPCCSRRPAMNERSAVALHKALEADWKNEPGWRGLSAVNHTVVARRFIVTASVFFLIGGVLAMVIRTQLATADNALLDSNVYSQIFTMHGTLMM